ncbi:nucleotidyltransferase family protein [Effusibacillus lacus]|uniref:Polymerase beta nucleotidyltransferase domain-containing protein n=1 Tax=Effusibacillus lacus TaxID=1348429 RepID=A0A292YJV0_9BACL|nr:nucleotidyltransferase domain-containing protein [Effusibacillus lacus]TCS74300.1 nucleotidyltransferase-like protein [Effusibacillus lacus]GAX88760.1 hypothetical protein EFBL_0374 [Effusibacillus lacus]
MQVDTDIKNQLHTIFSASPAVQKAILFGSRARGDCNPRSDIDLSIEAPEKETLQKAFQAEWLVDETGTVDSRMESKLMMSLLQRIVRL